ncbi:MAG: glycosyltransferase family 39 protein, partial [Lentisphaerae bacterium]|nr:glycosyltransferase family 39 protein [Lentisphaerota bacterium]
MKNVDFIKDGGYFFAVLVFLGVSVAGFLHFYKLGQIPAGVHIDEGSTAYNAFCICETGKDEHGTEYPLFFKAFGDYKNPVMIYVLAPVIKIFGMTNAVIRSPSAIFHMLASIAFFFLAYRLSHDKWISLGAAFVFSVLPWIFPVSRIMLCGFTAMLFFMIIGWLLLLRAFTGRSFISAVFAGLFFALAMYSTHSGRPVTAVMLICFVCAFNFLIVRRWKLFAAFVISYVICLMPMIVSVLGRPEALTNRFNAISVWSDSP